jgi:hypothetical protein
MTDEMEGTTERSDGDELGGEEKVQELGLESQDGRLMMAQGRARDQLASLANSDSRLAQRMGFCRSQLALPNDCIIRNFHLLALRTRSKGLFLPQIYPPPQTQSLFDIYNFFAYVIAC